MSSLPNIKLTSQWVDVYAETGISVGDKVNIQNLGEGSVILTESVNQPDSAIGFNQITKSQFVTSSTSPVGIWAFSHAGSIIQVSVSSGFVPTVGESQLTNYEIEEIIGNVPGREVVPLIMRGVNIIDTFTDVWGGGAYTPPVAPETWELVSTSTDDALGGIGARNVTVVSHDANYVIQTTTADMNGTTPVVIANTHIRPRHILISLNSAGSSHHNVGDIILRVSGGGETRNFMPATFSNSQDGHYTVEAGKTIAGIQIAPLSGKNRDGVIRAVITRFGANQPSFIGAEIPLYQSSLVLPILAPFVLPEKADLTFQASATNQNTPLFVNTDIRVFDNSTLTPALIDILVVR